MRLMTNFSAAVLAGSLACGSFAAPVLAQEAITWSQDEAELVAGFAALKNKTPESSLATETSVRALLSNIPDFISVDIGDIVEEDGGVIFKDISLTVAGEELPLGVSIEEFRAYGLDDAELTKLAAGETASVAERIDVRGVSLYGLEELAQMATDSYTEQLTQALEGLEGDENSDIVLDIDQPSPFTFNSYDFSIGQIVLDDLVWHAAPEGVDAGIVSLFGEEGPPEGKEAWALFAPVARFYRSFEASSFAYYDITAALDAIVEEDGTEQTMVVNFSIPMSATSGMSRGDIGLTVTQGMSYNLDMMVADDESGINIPMKMGGSLDLGLWQNVELSTLFSYLEKQEVPSSDLADLMSFGRGVIYGESSVIGGQEFYSVGKTSYDFSDWHWFIPEGIKIQSEDLSFNVGAYMGFIKDTMMSVPDVAEDPEADEVLAMFGSVETLLADNGLDVLNMDAAFDYAWNAETGEAAIGMDNLIEDVGAFKLGLGANTMPYEDTRTLLLQSLDETAENPISGEEFSQMFLTSMTLTDFEMMLDDDGGLEVRPGDRRREHRRAEAERHDPGHDGPDGRDRAGVPAARRPQRDLRRPRHRPRHDIV